jgi:hypothetical protein
MRRSLFAILLLLLSVPFGAVSAIAQDASPAPSGAGPTLLPGLGLPELALTTDGETLDIPAEIEAGRYYVSLTNTGTELMADLEIYQLPEGLTQDDLLAAFAEEDVPDWFFDIVSPGGVFTMPGGTAGAIMDLAPGEWIFNLYTYSEDYSTDVNTPTTVTVTGEMPTVEAPEAAVEVVMVDFDFQMPDTVPAGPAVWEVGNGGEQPHHLIVNRVPDGTTEEEFIAAAMAFFGPPASPEAMASPVVTLSPDDIEEVAYTGIVTSGLVHWVEFDLEPGTYAAVCYLPSPDGQPHVMLGMVQVFTVE